MGCGGHDAVGDHVRGSGAEGEAAGGGVGDECPPGEHVACGSCGAGAVVLGADPAWGAGHHAGAGHAGAVSGVCDAEVNHVWPSGREDDVLWLDVPVDHTGGVDGRQRLGGTGSEGIEAAVRERAVGGQMLVQGGARGIGRGQPRGIGLRVGREERCEARALDAGGELYFAAEPGPELRVLCLRGVDHFDGDPQSVGGESGMDGAHAPRAQTADDPVRADAGRVTGAGGLDQPARSGTHENPPRCGQSIDGRMVAAADGRRLAWTSRTARAQFGRVIPWCQASDPSSPLCRGGYACLQSSEKNPVRLMSL